MYLSAIVDLDARIKRLNWSEPQGMAAEGQSMLDLFASPAHAAVLELIRSAASCDETVSLTADGSGSLACQVISVHAFAMHDEVVVMAWGDNKEAVHSHTRMYNDLVNTVRRQFKEVAGVQQSSVESHFEEIQRLNSQLTNTRRQLEKANAQLQALNRDLESSLKKDALTGLLGQYQFFGEMEQKMREHPDGHAVFFFIDLDNFKRINDYFGHAAGDSVLVQFAQRLQKLPWDNVLRIRMSGDEFGLFLYGLGPVDEGYLQSLYYDLEGSVLRDPAVLETVEIPISASIGAAVLGRHTDDLAELIRCADIAMYQAKHTESSRRFCVYDPEQAHSTAVSPGLAAALDEVLNERRIFHEIQPHFDAQDGSVRSYSMYMRSSHPRFDGPGTLLETAAVLGKTYALERISLEVLLERAAQLGEWLQNKPLFISQGPYPGFHAKAVQDLRGHLGRSDLVVEIPAQAAMDRKDETLIHTPSSATSCRTAIKHFGSGRGSELRLLALAPDFVKVSMRDLPRPLESAGRKYLQLLTAHAGIHEEITLIAEDIETEAEMQLAVDCGVDRLQGHYLARPRDLRSAENSMHRSLDSH